MSALFFGPESRKLFGYHHAPRGTGEGAVVICPPWGPEYQNAHRSMRFVARRLAQRGFHVLRFDYSGTGDSWGETTIAQMDRWQEDVGQAIAQVRMLSGQEKVDLIGLRVGALVAASAAGVYPGVARIVLWDPVLDGKVWLSELEPHRPLRSPTADPVECAGQLVSATLLREFEEIGSGRYGSPPAGAALLLRTRSEDRDVGDEPPMWTSHLQVQWLEDVSPWLEDTSIWSGMLPARAASAIVEWMVRR